MKVQDVKENQIFGISMPTGSGSVFTWKYLKTIFDTRAISLDTWKIQEFDRDTPVDLIGTLYIVPTDPLAIVKQYHTSQLESIPALDKAIDLLIDNART